MTTHNSTCPIWGTPATEVLVAADGRCLESPRVGGQYFISGSAEASLKNCDYRVKVRLTTWLVEQRRLGSTCPKIMSSTVNDVKLWKDTVVSDRADGILRYLETRTKILGSQIGYRIPVNSHDDTQLYQIDEVYLELLAHSGCVSSDDLRFLLSYLQTRGFVELSGVNNPIQLCTLTVEGYTRLSELAPTYTTASRAFVAMWFDEAMDPAWEHGFAPAIREAGYDPVRVDREEHLNKIDDEIIAEIRRARFVVADFTHGSTGVRGGVYYEAGFAHGLAIPVIFTCRENSFANVHFDTRQYNHIVWNKT